MSSFLIQESRFVREDIFRESIVTRRTRRLPCIKPDPTMSLYVDTTRQIAVNGVDLVNRHELSPYQDRELQRFIDANAHIMSWKEREIPEQRSPRQMVSPGGTSYSNLSRELSRGASPQIGYSTLDKYFPRQNRNQDYSEIEKSLNYDPPKPDISRHNYVSDFPGIENSVDNKYLVEFIHKMESSRPSSAMSGHYNNYPTDTLRSSVYSEMSRGKSPLDTGSNYGEGRTRYESEGNYSNYGNYGTYGGIPSGRRAASKPPSQYGSMKRKGVSWSDLERTRSLSPHHTTSHSYQQSTYY